MAPLLAPARGRLIASTIPHPSTFTLPSFLVPAFHSAPTRRQFSATTKRQSKIGRDPVALPPGVEFTIGDWRQVKDATDWRKIIRRTLTVKGPLGTLEMETKDYLNVEHDKEANKVYLSVKDSTVREQKEMWGTYRAALKNHVTGVAEGHTAILRLVGIGFRATVEPRPKKEEYPGQPFLILKLGFSHNVEMGLPKGMKGSTPQPTRILLEHIHKVELHSFAAEIRRWRVPEPYKGKGIFVNDETIQLKQKKIK